MGVIATVSNLSVDKTGELTSDDIEVIVQDGNCGRRVRDLGLMNRNKPYLRHVFATKSLRQTG